MRYLHSMIRVKNLEESLNFYCKIMGFIEIRRRESENGRFTLVFLCAKEDLEKAEKDAAPLLELTYNWDKEELKGERNFGHLAYEVDNIYTYCQELQEKGVIICRPPRDGKMAFIRSPDGISIELLQKGPALKFAEPWLSMPNQGTW